MKIEKFASDLKGRDVRVKTSGGGDFIGEAGHYDKESNTLEVWHGWDKTTVDVDKIVSVNAGGSWVAGALILAVIIFGVWVWNNVGTGRNYDRYERGYYDRSY